MNSDYRILPLTIQDIPRMLDLWEKAGLPFKPQGRDSLSEIQRQMRTDTVIFLGALFGKNDDLVGTVVGTDDGRKGYLNRLAVLPDHRGKGVGSALLKKCELWLRQRGRGIITALVEEGNDASFEFMRGNEYEEHRDIVYFTKRDNPDV